MSASATAREFQGFEHDWLGVDAEGQVALFSSAGGGYLPPGFLEDPGAHDAAIDALLAAPPTTSARFAPRLPPDRENTWARAATRGLFAYDADAHGGPYRLVAAPEVPAGLPELPAAVASAACRVRLPQVRFGEAVPLEARRLQT